MRHLLILLSALPCSACMFAKAERPTVDVNVQAASQHNFRGQVMTDRPVLQASTAVGLPLRDGGTMLLRGWGNLDLTEDAGKAWGDDGHQGEFTQIDLSAAYARQIAGLDCSAGVVHYSWAHGQTFPFGAFPPTSEVFVRVGGEVLGFRPAFTAHHDFDAVDGDYLRAELARTVGLGGDWQLDLLAWQGWADDDHARWLYRAGHSVWADLGAQATVGWLLDDVTRLHAGVAATTLVDDDVRRWFRGRIDPDNVWFTVGIAWAL